MCESEFWTGCYKNFDLWHPDSYAHPAKCAPGLAFRIMEHLTELGLLRPGATILDPMNGIATTGIVAGALGHPYIGIELEETFIKLSEQNREYAEKKLHKKFSWQLIQGDSRKLSELLQAKGLVSVMSPPYIDQQLKTAENYHIPITGSKDSKGTNALVANRGYTTEGQIGNLQDKPLTITSPPYEDIRISTSDNQTAEKMGVRIDDRKYGKTEGNIGNTGESYLDAMRQVYSEIAKVSDVLVIILKNPTRNGKLRRLDLDSIELLEQTGWKIRCHHKALLFEESEQGGLFGESKKQVKGRMSFFKRLSYAKGSPVAQWEDIIFAVKDGGSNVVAVTSPPYQDINYNHDKAFQEKLEQQHRNGSRFQGGSSEDNYGSSPGQIGKLK